MESTSVDSPCPLPASLPSPLLRLALISPDSLTGYATQLQQALLNILHAQKKPSTPSALTDIAASLPALDAVSLYIQLPEESTPDFVYRLQQGALPQHISLPHLSSSSTHSLQHFDDHDDDADDEADEADDGEDDGQRVHHERHYDEQGNGEEEVDEDEEQEDEVRSWRVVDQTVSMYSRQWRSPSDEESVDEPDECEVEESEKEKDGQLPFAPFTPRHLRLHDDTDATVEVLSESEKEREAGYAGGLEQQDDEKKEADADREIALSVLQTVQNGLARLASQHRRDEADADEAEATAHSARQLQPLPPTYFHTSSDAHDSPVLSSSTVPPLDLSRLLSNGCHHINLLLYDGVREDIAFSLLLSSCNNSARSSNCNPSSAQPPTQPHPQPTTSHPPSSSSTTAGRYSTAANKVRTAETSHSLQTMTSFIHQV